MGIGDWGLGIVDWSKLKKAQYTKLIHIFTIQKPNLKINKKYNSSKNKLIFQKNA